MKQQQNTLQQQQQLLLQQQHQLLLAHNQMNFSPKITNTGEEIGDDDDIVDHDNLQQDATGCGGGGGDDGDDMLANDRVEGNNSIVAFTSSSPLPSSSQPVVSHRVESPPHCPPVDDFTSPSYNNRSSTSGAWAYRKARRVVAPFSIIPSGIGGGAGGIVSSISRVFNPRSSCRSTSTPNLGLVYFVCLFFFTFCLSHFLTFHA